MNNFFKYIGEFIREYPIVTLNRKDEAVIQDHSMNCLKLDNLNHLRDRFDGQAFLDKNLTNIGALLACQKYLNLPLEDISKLNLKDYRPVLNFDNKEFDIIVFDFGNLPVINEGNIKKPTIFVLKKDTYNFSLCGWTSARKVKENLIKSTVFSNNNTNKSFTGFKELNHMNDLKK